MKTRGIDTQKMDFAVYMRWVGWGRCVSYVRENCILYVSQTRSYHIHAKVNFYVSIPRVFVFISHTIYKYFHETFNTEKEEFVQQTSHPLSFFG